MLLTDPLVRLCNCIISVPSFYIEHRQLLQAFLKLLQLMQSGTVVQLMQHYSYFVKVLATNNCDSWEGYVLDQVGRGRVGERDEEREREACTVRWLPQAASVTDLAACPLPSFVTVPLLRCRSSWGITCWRRMPLQASPLINGTLPLLTTWISCSGWRSVSAHWQGGWGAR